MPVCLTRFHGEIAYAGPELLEFPRGPFGFAAETRFLPLQQPGTEPLVFLQSIQTPGLCFLALPVLVVDPDYRLGLSAEDLELLGLPPAEQPCLGADVLCLALVSIQEGAPGTANLLAPIVVNLRTNCALQAISTEAGYSHQHPLPVAEAVCS